MQADSIRAILMRQGFAFNKDDHATRLNLKGIFPLRRSRSMLPFRSWTPEMVPYRRFVPGNKITMSGWTNGGNNTTKIISTVTAGVITVTDTTGLVEEAAGNLVTIQADDELPTGNGYSQNGVLLTGQTVTEDDANDRAQMVCNDIDFSASGGTMGPTPGAILYDDTASEKTIIGYLALGTDHTIPNGSRAATSKT